MMIMRIFAGMLALALAFPLAAQSTYDLPEFNVSRAEVAAHMNYLASDQLAGRRTGSPGNDAAARYIAEQFGKYGLTTPTGADNYLQPVPFELSIPPSKVEIEINGDELEPGTDFIVLAGKEIDKKGRAVFAGHGWVDPATGHDDYANLDVRGKVVVVQAGPPDNKSPMAVFEAMSSKPGWAAERGAIGLIEVYTLPFPWQAFVNFFGGESLRLAKSGKEQQSDIFYAWMKPPSGSTIVADLQAKKKTKMEIESSGLKVTPVRSNNVIGMVEGSDPALRDQYILLTAHYDHVGVGAQGGQGYSPEDSIFNGARDNAFGTTALLTAAKALSAQRPARSVIFLAVTGEEIGLLGSEYYAENPLVPHDKVVYNLNTDGAGYNDTELVTIIGMGRTGTDDVIAYGAAPFGLEVANDPAPEQGLFDRSDNVSFAKRGIPGVTFSPGFTAFDAEISKYYHQAADNPETIDMRYLQRFSQAFSYTARLLANGSLLPFWISGDKYEEVGKELYNLD